MTRIAVLPDKDPQQSLRVRRFLMACLIYLMAIALMGFSVRLGFMALREWLLLAPAIVVFNGLIYLVLRSGWNESLADPSLTAVQMVVASVFMGITVYLLPDARGALLLLYLVILIFGILRMSPIRYMLLVAFSLACYATAMIAAWRLRPETVDVRVEFLQLAAMAMLIPCGGFLAAHVGGLRQRLRERQIELQRARETVYELSNKDELTGVYNRRSILEIVDEEQERAARLGSPLSLVMLDLDRFKRVNREFGHDTGDDILRRTGAMLQRCLRPVDEIGRYGGEEFLAVLPDTGIEEATRIAERLREAGTVCRPSELAAHLRPRISAGIAEHLESEDRWSLVSRASAASDEALRAGGNRVVASQSVKASSA